MGAQPGPSMHGASPHAHHPSGSLLGLRRGAPGRGVGRCGPVAISLPPGILRPGFLLPPARDAHRSCERRTPDSGSLAIAGAHGGFCAGCSRGTSGPARCGGGTDSGVMGRRRGPEPARALGTPSESGLCILWPPAVGLPLPCSHPSPLWRAPNMRASARPQQRPQVAENTSTARVG